MTLPEALARITFLEAELKRARNQLQKAYKDRADIHARLRRITSSSSLPINHPPLTINSPQNTSSPPP